MLQGLTEFLPISSSGHLVLLKNIFGMKEPNLFFDTMVHCGTLVAVLAVFRHDLKTLTRSVLTHVKKLSQLDRKPLYPTADAQLKLLGLIALACIPTAAIGFWLKDVFEHLFSSVAAVGVSLMVTGTLLLLTRFARHNPGKGGGISWLDALVIGCAQAVAITPGISRSGATIATALLLGVDREMAGRFSFLIFIPAILGAIILNAEIPDSHAVSYFSAIATATVAAGATGYGALKLLLRFVHRGKLHVFAPYCYVVGVMAVVIGI